MTRTLTPRERTFWVAAVAVLGISMTWLALVSAALALQTFSGEIHTTLAVARALVRALILLAQQGWAWVPAAVVIWALLGWAIATLGSGQRTKREVRHA